MSVKRWIMMGLLVLVMAVITCAAPVAAGCNHDCSVVTIPRLMRFQPDGNSVFNVTGHMDHTVNGLSFDLFYPRDLLQFVDWDLGSVTRNSLVTVSSPLNYRSYCRSSYEPGWYIDNCTRINVSIVDTSGLSGSNSLLHLHFNTLGSGESDIVVITWHETVLGQSEPTDCSCYTQSELVIGNLLGDCNGDGIITSDDALMALQMVNREIPADTVNADMDRDGDVDLNDVLEILNQSVHQVMDMAAQISSVTGTGGASESDADFEIEIAPGRIIKSVSSGKGGIVPAATTPATTPICAKGYTLCKSKCVNLLTDSTNCGACGKACMTGQVCSAGKCIASLKK